MSSKLELQIRAAKRRRAEAELLRKRKEQSDTSTNPDELRQLRTTNLESPKVVSFQQKIHKEDKAPLMDTVKGESDISIVTRPLPVVKSTKKRSRCWESPKLPIDPKCSDDDGEDETPKKPSAKINQKSRLSLDASSDDNSDSLNKIPSTSNLTPKRCCPLENISREGDSAEKPIPDTGATKATYGSDSDDSTLLTRRLLRRQAVDDIQRNSKVSPKQNQASLVRPPTKLETKRRTLFDEAAEDSELHIPACEEDSSRHRQNHSSSSSSDESEDEDPEKKRASGVPRNPLALQKREDEQFKASLAKLPPRVPSGNYHDGLSDSDPEPESEEERSRKASSKKKRNSSQNRKTKGSSSNPKQQSGRAYDGFWEDNNVLNSRGNLLSSCSDQMLAEQLHPDGLANRVFVNMTWKPFVLENGDHHYEVPASLARYLADFQREGIEFMFSCLRQNMGCILADDMGLGKTLQVLSLLSALFGKSGTGLDVSKMRHRQQLVKAVAEEQRQKERDSLMRGMLEKPLQNTNLSRERIHEFGLPERWWPVMIAVPPSVLTNWEQEIDKWTNLSFAVYSDRNTREKAISQITSGLAEVMLIKNSCFTVKERFRELCTIPVRWKLIVFDEFHTFKNKDATAVANIRELKSINQSLVVGMSGTVMQNNHQELWTLVDLVETNFLGDWNEFKYEVADPIKLGRAKSATQDLISISNAKANALQKKLRRIMIERKKELVLKEFLPSKKEKVVMCELSSMQKEVYAHILILPEIDYVRKASSPCDCTVNRGFFQHLNRLTHQSERVAYVREQQVNLVKRQDCCYQVPLNPHYVEGGNEPRIHPDAVIWRSMKGHAGDEPCDQCPFCCGFPVLAKLYKLANHLALLQAKKTNNADEVGHPENLEYSKQLAFARVALPGVATKLSGGYNLKDGIMDDHVALSGKIKVLDKLLAKFWNENSKALLFSYSTQTLDLIENYLKAMGQYVYLRMDGSTDSKQRQGLADEFNNNPTNFLFLLSTKAMGVGLNLTAASKVVIFDVEWNPSNDEQAQDRAYRIGQKQDVEVYRLVSQGTIDEMKYLRQLYKVQLKQETFAEKSTEPQAARIFKGVEGDKHRKGELFGYENLFRFKDGSFLNDIWKASGKNISTGRNDDLVIHDASKISDALLGIEEAKLGEILDGGRLTSEGRVRSLESGVVDDAKALVKEEDDQDRVVKSDTDDGRSKTNVVDECDVEAFDHGDLFRDDRGGAAIEEGDEGYDEEMGGQTQNVFEIFERGGVLGDENPQDGSADIGGSDDDDDDIVTDRYAAVALGNHVLAVDENIPEPVAAVVIDPVQRAPDIRQPQPAIPNDATWHWKSEEVEWVEESEASIEVAVAKVYLKKEANVATPRGESKTDPSDSKKSPSSDDSVEIDRQVRHVGSPANSGRLYPPVVPKVNLFGVASCHQKGAATDFSTSDLFLPTYKKTSKKKKK